MLAAVEPSDIVQRSSNPPPPPPNFEDPAVVVVEVVPVVTGEVTADRADMVLITGIAAYAGADAGVELGRTCNEGGASAVLRAPKGWGWDD